MMCNRSYSALSVATDIATVEDTRGKHVSGIQKRKYCFHNYLKIKHLFYGTHYIESYTNIYFSWRLIFLSNQHYGTLLVLKVITELFYPLLILEWEALLTVDQVAAQRFLQINICAM